MYKSIDLFAGIGGIRLGFEQAFKGDIKTVFVSEWDKKAVETYKANYNDGIDVVGDITKVDEKDIICEADGMNVVLLTDENYFLNNNMSEVTDGNYKILGKVIQICIEDGEISLLRNTVFSKLKLDRMNEFKDLFSDPSLSQFVGDNGLETVIYKPVIMVIPIAIYI